MQFTQLFTAAIVFAVASASALPAAEQEGIKSTQVAGQVYVCSEPGLKGRCETVTRGYGGCGQPSRELQRKIASFRPDPNNKCLLYSDSSCTKRAESIITYKSGEHISITPNMPAVNNLEMLNPQLQGVRDIKNRLGSWRCEKLG